VPDSYGKRQRNAQKAKKFAEREERRRIRKQERADREVGVVRPLAEDESTEPEEDATPAETGPPDAES
jgi:hypothetical protein